MWKKLTAVAPTLVYDISIVEPFQQGRALPADRWAIDDHADPRHRRRQEPGLDAQWHARARRRLPALVMKRLPGQTHMVKAAVLAPVLSGFFGGDGSDNAGSNSLGSACQPAPRRPIYDSWLRNAFEDAMSLLSDLRFALRSLLRVKGLALTVIVTLALGIGANAAIFSVVRGVLLRPLVNRDEAQLIYIRQSAPGIGTDNAAFSVPEIQDLRARVKSITAFGDFSQIGFTMVGLGEPRVVRAGVVGGNYFDVMGLKPVIGRLIGPKDDGPNAPGVAVLTYRFWTTGLGSDPTVLGKTLRLGERSATIIGVLEPSVPYPAETEIIANIVTSPHHLSATMVTGRVHRMTELFGRLAPGATLDSATRRAARRSTPRW